MRTFILVVACSFVAAFAWHIGSRISTDSLTLIIGFVFGVLAGIPGSLVVLAATRRKEEPRRQPDNYPPVILMGGGQQVQSRPPSMPQLPMLPQSSNRVEVEDW